MNSLLLINNSAEAKPSVKHLAYGNPALVKQVHPDIRMGRLHRLERGFPYFRQFHLNKPLFATPMFRGLTLYTLDNRTAQIPSSSITVGSISHPTLSKL